VAPVDRLNGEGGREVCGPQSVAVHSDPNERLFGADSTLERKSRVILRTLREWPSRYLELAGDAVHEAGQITAPRGRPVGTECRWKRSTIFTSRAANDDLVQ